MRNTKAEDLVELPGARDLHSRLLLRYLDAYDGGHPAVGAAGPWRLGGEAPPTRAAQTRESPFFPIRTQEIPGSLNFPGQIDVV